MIPRDYRPLLPAPTPESTPSTSETTEDVPTKRRRVGVTVACNLCRSKKTRCDGARPVCGICRKRGIDKCIYTDKKDPGNETLELLQFFKSASEPTAINALRLLRTNGDPSIVLSLIDKRAEDHPSGSDSGWTAPLLNTLPLETELMTKNSSLFPVIRPISGAFEGKDNLLRSVLARENPKGKQTQPVSPAPVVVHQSQELDNVHIDSDSAISQTPHQPSLAGVGNTGMKLCDERLKRLDISFWTMVLIPDELAAKVISLYLVTDHPLLGTFDPDKFVADLVDHKNDACSPFLVNTLLYWGCQMYSAIDKVANDYAQLHSEEALRLWNGGAKGSDTILNMIGAQMLSLAYMGNGRDHDVLIFQEKSVEMATRLGLMDVDEQTAVFRLAGLSKDELLACSYAAWGVYNWSVLVTIFYRQDGLTYIELPPTLPIPEDSGHSAASDISSPSYANMSDALPSYMGHTFTTICEFWRIMAEVATVYFSTNQAPSDFVTLEFGEAKYREILAWAENLPPALIRGDESPHHVLVLHMWIHCAIVDILRPFVQREESESMRLKTFSASDSSPAAAHRASINQLKRLIFDFRAHYEPSAYTILWHTALSYVATDAVHEQADPTSPKWFLFCLYGYEVLRRPFRISEAIGRGLLTMNMRDTNATSDDSRNLLRQLQQRGLASNIEGEIRATFMGDLGMAGSNPEGASVENLADGFEGMAVFKDFIMTPEDLGFE